MQVVFFGQTSLQMVRHLMCGAMGSSMTNRANVICLSCGQSEWGIL